MKANAQSHTHSQFATANATPKIAKEYVFLPTLLTDRKIKYENTTMAIIHCGIIAYKKKELNLNYQYKIKICAM